MFGPPFKRVPHTHAATRVHGGDAHHPPSIDGARMRGQLRVCRTPSSFTHRVPNTRPRDTLDLAQVVSALRVWTASAYFGACGAAPLGCPVLGAGWGNGVAFIAMISSACAFDIPYQAYFFSMHSSGYSLRFSCPLLFFASAPFSDCSLFVGSLCGPVARTQAPWPPSPLAHTPLNTYPAAVSRNDAM